jgi:signal transduction histidine kinase
VKDPLDSVTRSLPIEEIAFHERQWALSLEAFRLARGGAAGLVFRLLSGWPAYLTGAGVLVAAHVAPYVLFRQGWVLAYLGPLAAAWLSAAAAATYSHFVDRRSLAKSETERARYRQAIHFVTHEMRTPLTAIQGSSELMGRYNLPEEKRKQMAGMINLESKRLARMVQTFLDVERLSEGEMELKHEAYGVRACLEGCAERARVIAERKQIRIVLEEFGECELVGDRELMEYAFYNLLTNAVKYSPAETTVRVWTEEAGGRLRVAVMDQGIGMDEKELKKIFTKFYRTKRAEASGEVGTGIGLSIVEQIVAHHGGEIAVTSQPGKGSCFTVILPLQPAN